MSAQHFPSFKRAHSTLARACLIGDDRRKMKTRAKSIIGRLATWAYVVCAVLSVVFTISYFRSEGGPQVMGYAVVFILLFFCAVCAIGSIAATGAWKEKKKIVYVGALAWPLPIYLSALVVRAMFAS